MAIMSRLTKVIASAAIVGVALAVTPEPLGAKEAFEQFQVDYGKVYDQKEREARYEVFKKNYAYIQDENSKGLPYKLGINEFADLTFAEFRSTRLGLGLPANHAPFKGLPYLGVHTRSNKTLPKSVDWRAKGGVVEVKNQARCGSCWAFSSTGALEGAWKIASGKLVSLSEQQLVDCSKENQGCNGGLMDYAFTFEEHQPVCTEESYPYTGKQGTCKKGCTAGIPMGGVVGYKDVAVDEEGALEDAVAQQPVSVAIEADRPAFQLYHSGVLTARCGVNLDHGVLAVGYGTEDGQDYWLVKNSWGPQWGLQGYVKLARGDKNGDGECGIQKQPSYPVVKNVAPGPSPPPGPPPPAPKSHYGKPPCQADEVQASLQDGHGSLCAPECTSSECPSDAPEGTTATPRCILSDGASHKKYCGLVCHRDSQCGSGGATCDKTLLFGLMGVCVYGDVSSSNSTIMPMPSNLEQGQQEEQTIVVI